MNSKLLLLLFLLPIIVKGQIISTFAGTGGGVNSPDGTPATSAGINYPALGTFDLSGNYYLTLGIHGETVRKITTAGIITTIAGTNNVSGYSGDNGPATLAKLNGPQGIAVDAAGNIYVSDPYNNRVRKIDLSSGIITTFAGNGSPGYSGDGTSATAAAINDPNGLCFDHRGNLYIADYGNNVVRKVTPGGIISTFAGNGNYGYTGDGGFADTTELRGVLDLCSDDSNNIYLADEINGRIRKIDTFGIIHTVAGNGIEGCTGDGGLAISAQISPHTITIDKYGNIYFSDIYTNRVRVVYATGGINTAAGDGIQGYTGDGVAATATELNGPGGLTTDSCGNLYVGDLDNFRVRKVTYYTSCTPTTTDFGNLEDNQSIVFYPNPATDILNIKIVRSGCMFYLLNTTGTTLEKGNLIVGTNSINTGQCPPGLYLLELIDGDGKTTISKFVKQ